MDVLIIILVALGVVAYVFTYFYSQLSGGTKSSVAGSSIEQARVIDDLGAAGRTFTNYTPWRFRFGVLLLVIGIACAALGRIGDYKELYGLAGIPLVFGIVTMLYVALMRINTLELHTRGLVLREGKSNATAAYYADIVKSFYKTVVYTTSGTQGRPVAKALVIELNDGSSFEVATDFMQFGEISDAITEFANICAAVENVSGTYLVTGRNLNDDEPMEVEIEARSPRHARTEAFSRYGLIVEDCHLRAGKGTS